MRKLLKTLLWKMFRAQSTVENKIQSATDEGLESLDSDSFDTIVVIVATTKSIPTSTTMYYDYNNNNNNNNNNNHNYS